ncbi:ATP-binding protein [Mesorhizobium temperatum]|nr:ATP-binding protein [Mesorhizobium temperatum]
MKFDVRGRIRNMRLPDGRTALFYSIYEAISNAIHAIEERFGVTDFSTRGVITIVVEQNDDKTLRYIGISDNGIGLNSTHLIAFETCDTLQKEAKGGRGVGRLVWSKVFRDIKVKSTYETGMSGYDQVSFTFKPELDDSFVDIARAPSREGEMGTQIILSSIDPNENSAMSTTILTKNLCHHFFPYFIAGGMPRLNVQIGRRRLDIGSYLSTRVVRVAQDTISIDKENIGDIVISHVYVDKSISHEFGNSILLTAQGRVVKTIEIEKKFSLRTLANGKAYVCVVGGRFLDDRADQERTAFKALDSEVGMITDVAMNAAEAFLGAHIAGIRTVQRKSVLELLSEHPQLALSVKDVEQFVGTLSPSMSDEDIGKTLFTLLYRHEKRLRADIRLLDGGNSDEDTRDEFRSKVDSLVQKVSDDAKRRLAEYTIKRHQIIQLARSMLRYSDGSDRKYVWEKAVHELICPMGKMLSAHNYDDHNLWLIDDLLSYYSFFASDKPMTSFGVDGQRQEPDLIFFNPYGFRREGTTDPVVIIEFKRPGDETLTSDPVDQVLDYIERLRGRTVRGPEGEVISDIDDRTPFECIVICDLTEGAKKKFVRSLAQTRTPDGQGFYGYSSEHNASIRVLSYSKVFRDAEARNRSFFDRLGLLPEAVREALSEATSVAAE